jgi:ornithine cyclodeaminase/alanine dehydrogenase-like protein (mu-crystallin family)
MRRSDDNSERSDCGEHRSLLVLGAAAIARALRPADCLAALAAAYRDLAAAPGDRPQSVAFKAPAGKLHVKAALMPAGGRYFAAKTNANFPGNPEKFGLPTIQGAILLFSAENGRLLALLESGALTGLRTAATAALAATFGARAQASRLAVIGAGAQAPYGIDAMAARFALADIAIADLDPARAEALADRERGKGRPARAAALDAAVRDADIVLTLTPSRRPVISSGMVREGAFVAAMGADNPDKQEIDPDLFAAARVIADDPDQCAKEGDLAHALRAGTITRAEVVGALADLAAGRVSARRSPDDVVLFDSTGSGLQVVAAAAAAYERAMAEGAGVLVGID